MSSAAQDAPGGRATSVPRWLERLRDHAEIVARKRPPRGQRRFDLERARSLMNLPGARPLTVAGAAAGAGLVLGVALALSGKRASAADEAEEIVARALCREDPDTQTHRGPLWTGYRKDARRVLAALRSAGLLVERE